MLVVPRTGNQIELGRIVRLAVIAVPNTVSVHWLFGDQRGLNGKSALLELCIYDVSEVASKKVIFA